MIELSTMQLLIKKKTSTYFLDYAIAIWHCMAPMPQMLKYWILTREYLQTTKGNITHSECVCFSCKIPRSFAKINRNGGGGFEAEVCWTKEVEETQGVRERNDLKFF